MTRPYIPFIAFLILLLSTISFSFDFATSVVSGWHTTIIPPYFIRGHVVLVVLLLLTIGYWLLSKRTDKTNWSLFAVYCALTIPTVIYLKFPSILLDVQTTDYEKMIKALEFRMKLVQVAWALFIAGQILFPVYFVRTIRAKRVVT
jgi:hypothetical protein